MSIAGEWVRNTGQRIRVEPDGSWWYLNTIGSISPATPYESRFQPGLAEMEFLKQSTNWLLDVPDRATTLTEGV